jgi:hypothetical protein
VVTLQDTAGTSQFQCKLWDETTVIDAGPQIASGTSQQVSLSLSGFLASPAANIRIDCKDVGSSSGLMLFNTTGTGKDSTVSAHRIQ